MQPRLTQLPKRRPRRATGALAAAAAVVALLVSTEGVAAAEEAECSAGGVRIAGIVLTSAGIGSTLAGLSVVFGGVFQAGSHPEDPDAGFVPFVVGGALLALGGALLTVGISLWAVGNGRRRRCRSLAPTVSLAPGLRRSHAALTWRF